MPDLRGRCVLVSGAAGFLGANLIRELLRQGAAVHAVVRPGSDLRRIADIATDVTLHLADLRDQDDLRRVVAAAKPQGTFHLAVRRADGDPSARQATLATNVLGTANLLEATATCDDHRFIHLGSLQEYGPAAGPLPEDAVPAPRTFYGATKAAATLLCQQAASGAGRDVAILRPSNVYGPWEAATRLVPAAIAAALAGQTLPLTVPGYRRDWVFIADVVDACLRALVAEGIAGEIINIGSGRQQRNEEVVALVREVTGCELRVAVGAYPARPWDRGDRLVDIDKARRMLGWEPRHTLRDGLAQTVAWHQAHVLPAAALAAAW